MHPVCFFCVRRASGNGLFAEGEAGGPVTNGNAASGRRPHPPKEERLSEHDRSDRCARMDLVRLRRRDHRRPELIFVSQRRRVGGWRQKEKPLLYNVFHIGDQIMRVGHCNVSSAAEVHRLIKSETGSQVNPHFFHLLPPFTFSDRFLMIQIEFIVRRVPFGRVFHLLRESEGQSVGIVTEGSTAEIREVVPGGIAALAGLSPLAVSPLSSSFCTWTLTEINGRPLNLCSKEGEARDRLNAVGKAITILVQPTDFVKALKKQLKSLRGYKDYLLG